MRSAVSTFLVVGFSLGISNAALGQCEPVIDLFPGAAGVDGDVFNMQTFDVGQGPMLALAGDFSHSGGVTTRKVADFDGAVFDNLAAGVTGGYGGGGFTRALAMFQGYLCVGGNIDAIGGVYGGNLAYWNGSGWYYIGNARYVVTLAVMCTLGENGTLISGNDVGDWEFWDGAVRTQDALPSLDNGEIEDSIVHDDGSGEALYAVGSFRNSAGSAARRFVKWAPGDAGWSPVGGGVGGGAGPEVVHDIDVRDEVFYLGGVFATAGGEASGGVASWNGADWTHFGAVEGAVYDLEWFDDGSGDGPALYAGGLFTAIGGVPAANLARWRNGAWEAVGAGASAVVYELHVADLGDGPALYIAGDFVTIDGQSSSRFAVLRGCEAASTCPGDVDGDGFIGFADLNAVVSSFNTFDGDPGYNAAADFDGDGDVDFADLNVVLSAFNSAC